MQSEREGVNNVETEPARNLQVTREDATVRRNALPPSGREGGRFDQLDSLRGIAALTVMVCHMMDVYPTFSDRPLSHDFWWQKMAVFPILVLSFAVTLAVTAAAYLLFEMPSILLGRRLSARIGTMRRQRLPAPHA